MWLAAPLLTGYACLGQSRPSLQETPPATIKATSTLVMVPTLVRTPLGELVPELKANNFRLIDNGVEQKVSVEMVQRQPIAVVVLMQTGGAAPRQFQNYQTMTTLLGPMMGSSIYKVAMVTFDSRPQEIWNFPPRVDGLQHAFIHPERGDRGAAILDAVNLGIELLQQQPLSLRRIILLMSQPVDDESKVSAADVVRRIGESNATIYSVSFSPEKPLPNDPLPKAPVNKFSPIASSNALEAPASVLKAMQEDTAAEVAALSGGEQVRLKNKGDLEHKVWLLANDLANGYTLSFRPSSKEPGFHTVKVEVVGTPGPFVVAARTSYWIAGTVTKK